MVWLIAAILSQATAPTDPRPDNPGQLVVLATVSSILGAAASKLWDWFKEWRADRRKGEAERKREREAAEDRDETRVERRWREVMTEVKADRERCEEELTSLRRELEQVKARQTKDGRKFVAALTHIRNLEAALGSKVTTRFDDLLKALRDIDSDSYPPQQQQPAPPANGGES